MQGTFTLDHGPFSVCGDPQSYGTNKEKDTIAVTESCQSVWKAWNIRIKQNTKQQQVNAGTKLNDSCWRTLDNMIKFAPLSLNFSGPEIL